MTTLETAATSPAISVPSLPRSRLGRRRSLTASPNEAGAGRAVALADAVVAGLEGATILARARRDTTPLRNTARMLAISVKAATSGATD